MGIIALLMTVLQLFGASTASAATPEQMIMGMFKSGDASSIASALMPKTTPVASAVAGVTPTPAALATRGPTTYYVAGTGGGQDSPAVHTDKGTYVVSPYPASILPGPIMGPYSYGDSVQIGAAQAVANSKVNPQPVNEFNGHSQGASAAWEAAAKDGQASHITATGTPTNPGTGFVSVMPSNLFITDVGTPSELAPEDSADLYNLSGDCWGNMPDFRNVLSLIACIPSTIDTHYNQGEGGYGTFKEDEVYKSAPNITQHVQYTENGLVLIGQQLNPNLPEDQKQMLRDLAPQGRPGVQSGPTLRELTDPVGMVQDAVEGALTQAPAAVNNDASVAPANPVAAIAEVAAPLMEQFAAQAPPEVQQFVAPIVEQWSAPEPTYTAQQQYSAPAPVQDFVQNVQTQVQNVVSSFATPAVGNVNAAPAAPAMPALPDLGALAASFMGGV